MLAGPLTIFVLGIIVGIVLSWKFNRWLIIYRLYQDDLLKARQTRDQRKEKHL